MKAFKIIGPKRSGHHAIANWILSGVGPTFYLNDVFCKNGRWKGQPQKLPSVEHSELGAAQNVAATFERGDLEKIKSLDLADCFQVSCTFTKTIYVLRDPFNCAASYFEKIIWRIKNRINDNANWDEWGDWRSHRDFWQSVYHNSKTENDAIIINFDRWFIDGNYRSALAVQIGVEPKENSHESVPKIGRGSSFDTLRLKKNASQMQINDRWKSKIQRHAWRVYVRSVSAEAAELWPELSAQVYSEIDRVPKNKITVLLGPFGGEFGCELLYWQGYCRFLSKTQYEGMSISIATRKDRYFFYQDFVSKFVDIEIENHTNSLGPNPNVPKKRRWRFQELKRISDDYPCKGTAWIQLKENAFTNRKTVFFQYEGRGKEPFVLIHARANKSNRQWANVSESDPWDQIVGRLASNGFKSASIGHPNGSLHIPGTIDLRGISISELAGYCRSSPGLIGTCSGPTHFAMLSGIAKIICWGNRRGKRNVRFVNPFGTEVSYQRTGAFPLEFLQKEIDRLSKLPTLLSRPKVDTLLKIAKNAPESQAGSNL